jgi:rfaE bifunctional protein nucleotidyltransferase chain/domain
LKILDQENLVKKIEALRRENKSIVLCHGVFDLIHPGHLEHFRQAKTYGDVLVVSITDDKYVKKGVNRPFFNSNLRAHFLEELNIVDLVHISLEASGLKSIELVKPNFYVKGSDYKNLKEDYTGKISLEKAAVEASGGKLVFTSGFTSSSTNLINSSLIKQETEITDWRELLKKQFSLDEIHNWIDKLENIPVVVVGETIIDSYTYCEALAKSSKDPILAFRVLNKSEFEGGALAIANICSAWTNDVKVISVVSDQDISKFNSKTQTLPKYLLISSPSTKTIKKDRFVDLSSGAKVFETYDFVPENIDSQVEAKVLSLISSENSASKIFMVADYGHGLITEKIASQISNLSSFTAVNTQANAGNRGFNSYTKYSRFDFLSLNGGELELELRKKNLNYESVIPTVLNNYLTKNVVVTLGKSGLIVFDGGGNSHRTPALAVNVVDKVGTGDSVLAIASMLSFAGAPIQIIGLVASVVAAHEVGQRGHQSSLSINDIKGHVRGILS